MPKLKDFLPKLKDFLSKLKDFLPKLKDFLPKLKLFFSKLNFPANPLDVLADEWVKKKPLTLYMHFMTDVVELGRKKSLSYELA